MKILLFFSSLIIVSLPAFANDWFRQTALSPDGRQIAFGYKGNIYTVGIDGGEAKLFAGQSFYEGHPVWSHDGKTIAYASDAFGNMDVFVKPAEGGLAQRLTYHSSNDLPSDFSTDNGAVLFSSLRDDLESSSQFPYRRFTELYLVSLEGGTPVQVNTLPLEAAKYSRDGSSIIYQDRKSPENVWRKHHTSSAARDIWVWDKDKDVYTKVTDFKGEDRAPFWGPENKSFFYLSEKPKSFNVWQKPFNGGKPKAITNFTKHPVRDLSVDKNGNMVFTHHGSIFYRKAGAPQSQKLEVVVRQGDFFEGPVRRVLSSGASEVAVSPSGKEIALIVRGEVFVTSMDFRTTKRVTNTPEQERSVSFSPDGKSLVYASERNGSWNLYESRLTDPKEKYFFGSTQIKERDLLVGEEEAFAPQYSPNGLEVAFVGNRDAIRVLNIKSRKVRTILPEKYNTTYTDFDLKFSWSPDSQWIAAQGMSSARWLTDILLIKANGPEKIINLSNSGYDDFAPSWEMEGQLLTWQSLKYGKRNHGSWGAQANVFGLFLTQAAMDKFYMSKEERALADDGDGKDGKKDKSAKKKKKKKNKQKPLVFESENFEKRIRRLSRDSANLSSVRFTKDGKKMYFLEIYSNRFQLWQRDFVEEKLKKLYSGKGDRVSFELTKDDKKLILYKGSGAVTKLDIDGNNVKAKPVAYRAELFLDSHKERLEMFEHVWRQTLSKFYVKDMHGVDWVGLKEDYFKKISAIGNNRDFAVLLSELLGELNASHTGAGFRPSHSKSHSLTASLGVYFDRDFKGKGLKISKIFPGSPLGKSELKIKPGMVIGAIDGVPIDKGVNIFKLLNHKAGRRVRLTFEKVGWRAAWGWGKEKDRVVVPFSLGEFNELKYQDWVLKNRKAVEKLSEGRLGYVHVRGMSTRSFQDTYSEVLGRHNSKEALIVDTRHNGGGWLHDDLNSFLSGKVYFRFLPRGRHPNPEPIGVEPMGKWTKPSIVMVNEANYSDAYLFPYSYQKLGIGKLVGMPVAATGTAVWWETLQSGNITFGIPQVGILDNDGKLQENRDMIPDYQVENLPQSVIKGQDLQIEKAVSVLLEGLGEK